MHACSCTCMLIIVSVFIFVASATDFISIFGAVDSIVVHSTLQEEQTTPNSDEGLRRKRSISSTDTTNIINKINSLRGSVGASNMNYLTYSDNLELDTFNWTSYCDFDARIYSTKETQVIAHAGETQRDYISLLEEIYKLTTPKFYNTFRSVYLQSVGAGQTYCSVARVKGVYYRQVYLAAYSFSHTSNFNENQTQFMMGTECTTCLSGSYWCDKGLCRDDCSGQISTCTCYTSCPKCQDWNRRSCKCPSQPYVYATALNCSKRVTGNRATTVRSAASWAMIFVSTLAFFHLQ